MRVLSSLPRAGLSSMVETAAKTAAETPSPDVTLLIDARPWQGGYATGRAGLAWAEALLARSTTRDGPRDPFVRVALVDRALPPLESDEADLFDRQQAFDDVRIVPDAVLVQPLPLSHAPHPIARWVRDDRLRSVAMIDDTLLLRLEGDPVFPGVASAWRVDLSASDAFVTQSGDGARWLQRQPGFQDKPVHVGAVGLDLAAIGGIRAPGPPDAPYFLVSCEEGEARELELPLVAHALCESAQRRRVPLLLATRHGEEVRVASLLLARDCGGSGALVEFHPQPQEVGWSALCANALATVLPEKRPGFPARLIEANARGCPVLVVNTPANADFVSDDRFRFAETDYQRMARLMDELAVSPVAGRTALVADQGRFADAVSVAAARRGFETFVRQTASGEGRFPAPALLRDVKPRLAIMSPLPPEQSGVADYTVATMRALSRVANLDIYTPTAQPAALPFSRSLGPISEDAYRSRQYDARISVIGNSGLHLSTFTLLLEHGGACIAHDARMLHFYAGSLGRARTLEIAAREMGRDVDWSEIEAWLEDQSRMPILFLSELAASAVPFFVHSRVTQRMIGETRGGYAKLLPFVIYRRFLDEFGGDDRRARAREQLGINARATLLVTLGNVTEDKGLLPCLEAVANLADGGEAVQFAIVGSPHDSFSPLLKSAAHHLGIEHLVSFTDAAVPERVYQAYLAAADAAVQLRSYDFGSLSGALLDCIAAGVPTVASLALATAMDAVSYVHATPDDLDVVSLTASLRRALERRDRRAHEEERLSFAAAHHVDLYARKLMDGLGFA